MKKTQTKTDKKDKAIVELSEKELAQAAGGKRDRRIIVYSTTS